MYRNNTAAKAFTNNTPLLACIETILQQKHTRMPVSTTTLAEQDMDGRVIPDVIVPQGASVLQQLAGKHDALLYGASVVLLIDLQRDNADSI